MDWMKWMVGVCWLAASGCSTDGSATTADAESSESGSTSGEPDTCDFPYAAVTVRVYYLDEPTDAVDVTYSVEDGPVLPAACMDGVCNVPQGTGQSITIWAEGFGCTESRTVLGGGGCEATYSPDVQFDFEPNCGAGPVDESSSEDSGDASTTDASTSEGTDSTSSDVTDSSSTSDSTGSGDSSSAG